MNSTEKYYIFYETLNGQKQYIWASGNAGYALVASKATPDDYPTTPYPFGIEGNCVKMETKSTGVMGSLVKMPIAAGSLFIGEFVAANAMLRPLKTKQVSVTFELGTIRLKGNDK